MRKINLIIAFFILANIQLFAQGGSNYSIFGVGDIQNSHSARFEAIGGTSIAIPSPYAINLKNPAQWANVMTTRIQAGYNYNLRNIEQGIDNMYQSNAAVNQIMGIFAIDTSKGIAASFGVVPYSSVNYLVKKHERISDNNFDIAGESLYQGSGGISQAFLGLSTKIFNWFKVGLSFSTFFGKSNQSINTVFYDYINQNQINRKSTINRGFLLKGGLVLEPIKNLYFGFIYDKVLSTKSETEIYFDGTYNYVTNDSTHSYTLDAKLPDSYGVGIGYQLNEYIFGADFTMQDFSNFTLNKNDKFEYRNSFNASAGISRIGQGGFRKTFFDKVTYNLGVGYKQLYYKVFGQDINEYYGSFGLDIPVSNYFWINTAFTFGVRGVNENNAIKETFGRLNVNLSIGETWFKPFSDEL